MEMKVLSMLGFAKRSKKRTPGNSLEAIFDQYEQGKPDHQNAIDALPGWNSAFPAALNLNAGKHHLYADDRIDWALRSFGSIEGKKILEVGPLEGMHTYMLHRERPARDRRHRGKSALFPAMSGDKADSRYQHRFVSVGRYSGVAHRARRSL